jgi:hypothetical protein
MESTNTIETKTIERLWTMGAAKASKNRLGEIDCYLCYCKECKTISSSNEGGIGFGTAEELLEHRNVEAFECPSGCGFHVCKQFGSIMSHITGYHDDILNKLVKEGLDTTKKQMIYPDHANNTYTLTNPMPMDASALENGGKILSMTARNIVPKRIQSTPTPPPSQQHENGPKQRTKSKFVPLKFTSNKVHKSEEIEEPEKISVAPTGKTWNFKKHEIVSLVEIMDKLEIEKKKETESDDESENEKVIHYAQEDMLKEKQCRNENCKGRKNPFACAFNHDGQDDIIPCGTQLTKEVLCPNERPPFMRCENTTCSLVHLKGRVAFIMKKKTEYYNPIKDDKIVSKEKPDFTIKKTVHTKVKKVTQVDDFTDEDEIENDENDEKEETIVLAITSKDTDDEIDLSNLTVFAEQFNHIQNSVATA